MPITALQWRFGSGFRIDWTRNTLAPTTDTLTTLTTTTGGGVDFDCTQELMEILSRRVYIRDRLSDLNTLIAALTAERDAWQAESDSITYPILSLPPEITAEIFLNCTPPGSMLRPSPSTAPLLLAQICRPWRQIALTTPELWQSLVFGDESSVEILKFWLFRARDGPLNYSFESRMAARADAMIEASLDHCHHWQDISFSVPVESYPKLHVDHRTLPMLRSMSLNLFQYQPGNQELPLNITLFQNSPSLREAHISTLPCVKFDFPLNRLTALTLYQTVDIDECMNLLRQCPGLVHLAVSVTDPARAHQTTSLTMHHVVSFTSERGTPLEYLTLPCLERLTLHYLAPDEDTIFNPFIQRSGCPLKYLSFSMNGVQARALRSCLRAAPMSIVDLELIWRGPRPGGLFNVLRPGVLPQLTRLKFHGARLSQEDYENFVAMLWQRRRASPETAVLNSVVLDLALYSELKNLRFGPRTSTIAEFRALSEDGLNIRFTLSGTPHHSTLVVFDSALY
ncbi:hypothetical protein B0H11DRAFT_2375129 [Mycena galericulata]|nr:hypothetical protein B0H11DRAFT_2375129 [Mycena galericulata]